MDKTVKKNMFGWCLIPPAILSREDISGNQKLLMGRILGLLNDEGYCFASNAWLGIQLSLKRIRVSQLLSDLQKKGLLEIKVIRNANRSIIKRKIFPVIYQVPSVIENNNPCYKKVKGVLSKSDIPLLSKSEKVVIENREIERESNHQISKKSDVQNFIDFYFKEYGKKFKTTPPFKGGRDGQTVKTLLKVMTVDILKTTVIRFLETEDLFFRKNGYDIPRFEKFIDGLKCGAYEEKEEYTGMLDLAGNPLKKLNSEFKPEVYVEEVSYGGDGLPIKIFKFDPSKPRRKSTQEKFKEGLL